MSLRGGLLGMNRSTFWWFSLIGMGIGTVALLISSGNAIAVSAAPPKAETEATPPAAWLIQVQHVERRDPPQADLDAIDEIRNKLKESIGTSMPADEREHLLKELARLTKAADARRGFVVYGWSTEANEKGWPTSSRKSMTGFLLPFDEAYADALDNAQLGDFLLVPTESSRDLIVVGGRHYFNATGARKVEEIGDWEQAKPMKELPPDRRSPDVRVRAARAVDVALVFSSTKEGKGGSSFRYSMKLSVPNPPARATRADIWLLLRFVTETGETLGPFLDHTELSKGSTGKMGVARGFEIFAPTGTQLNPTAATAEVLDVVWDGRGSSSAKSRPAQGR